jgi:hypothetical protein
MGGNGARASTSNASDFARGSAARGEPNEA